MAFSEEQKRLIKERARALLASNPQLSKGDAAQQAVKELFSPEQLTEVLAPVKPVTVEPIVDERSDEIKAADIELRDLETKFIRERTRQIEAQGIERQVAEEQARAEIEAYREPAPLGFGTPKERREEVGGLFKGAQVLPEPLAPQVTPIAKEVGPSGIDYKAIGEIFAESYGESLDEGLADAEAFRQFIVEPRLKELKESGVIGPEASRQAIEQGFAVLQDIQSRIEDKERYLQPETIGSGDPLIRAFSRQVELGEGVPDLTLEQVQFINAREQRRVERAIDEKRDEEKTVIILQDGREIDAADFDPQFMKSKGTKKVKKTEADIRRELGEEAKIPWYLDPKKKVEVIADPDKFEKVGILTSESPYGTKVETGANWLFRSALTIPNAVAGAGSKLAYDLGPLAEAREEARKKEGYDSAVLLNIAKSRGFMGEAEEAARLAGIEEDSPLYYTTVAGGFAADLLDPSLDVMKAAGVAGKSGSQAYRAMGNLYEGLSTSARASEAAKIAGRIGYRDFLDNNLIGNVIGKNFDAGDVRGSIARNLTDDYTAAMYATDAETVDEAIQVLRSEGLDKTRYAKSLEKYDPSMSIDDVLAENKKIFKGDSIEDDLISLKFGRGARRKDIARSIGAIAATDEQIKTLLKNVPKGKKTRLDSFVDALLADERGSRLLRKSLAADKAARDVIDATKGIEAFDNLVAITKNTWAGKGSAKTILERAKKSEVGKIAQDISDSGRIKLVATADQEVGSAGEITRGVRPQGTPKVQPAYELSEEQVNALSSVVEDLKDYAKINSATSDTINARLRKGIITVTDLRQVIDANIDLIAEGLSASESLAGVTRSRDLARLPVGEQIDILEPLEGRFFTRPWLRKVKESLIQSKKIEGNLSIGQRQLLRKAEADAAALDQRLIRDLKRALKDPEFRALYGIEEGATRSEILAHLVVGPKESVVPSGARTPDSPFVSIQDISVREGEGSRFSRIESLLKESLNDFFFTQETKENIFDVLTGTHVSRNTSVFTEKAYEQLSDSIFDAVSKIDTDPSQFFYELQRLAEEAGKIVDSGDQSLIKYKKDDITKILEETGKISPEIQIASFYRSEAQKIIDDLMSDLINKEIGKGQLQPEDTFDKEYLDTISRAISDVTGEESSVSREFMIDMINHQIQKILKGGDVEILPQDLSSILNVRMIDDDPELVRLANMMEPIAETTADIARGIIRRNKLVNNDLSFDRIERLFNEVKSSGNFRSDLKLLFGEDVAKQLEDNFLSGYESLRSELLNLQAKQYEKGLPASAKKGLSSTYEVISNFLYTAMLNLRPRFHGANLLTGMDIAYSTTGKIVNPIDVLEGSRVVVGKNPQKVMFTDPSGRPYTQGELQSILQDVTGRSVYGLNLPQAQSNRLINLLKDTKKAKLGEYWEVFKELPQSEDLLFRYAILKSALMEGRSLDEAIALARRSMFDAGNITDIEKKVKNIALFYGFARNNLLNTLQNMASLKGVKRIGKVKRLRDNMSRFFAGEETEEYAPSYASSRVLLGKIGFDPEKGKELIITSAPLATLDGVYTLAEFIKLEPSGVFGSAVRPEYKSLFGVEDKFDREFKQVPPEHVALLKMSGFDPADVINMIVGGLGGEEVISVPGKTIEGAVDGVVYPLNTPKQRAAYKKFYDAIAFFGMTSLSMDIPRSLKAEGTKVGEIEAGGPVRDFLTALSFGTGAMTPMASFSPERQAYYDRLSRIRDLQSIVKGTATSESKRLQEEAPAEEKQQAKEIKEKREELKKKKKVTPKNIESRMLEIRREVNNIKMSVRTGSMTLQEGRARMSELQEEVEQLKKEYNRSR